MSKNNDRCFVEPMTELQRKQLRVLAFEWERRRHSKSGETVFRDIIRYLDNVIEENTVRYSDLEFRINCDELSDVPEIELYDAFIDLALAMRDKTLFDQAVRARRLACN